MFVKPTDPKLIVRDPHTKQPLPADGGEVAESGPTASYWHRRIKTGDVELAQKPAPVVQQKDAPIQDSVTP